MFQSAGLPKFSKAHEHAHSEELLEPEEIRSSLMKKDKALAEQAQRIQRMNVLQLLFKALSDWVSIFIQTFITDIKNIFTFDTHAFHDHGDEAHGHHDHSHDSHQHLNVPREEKSVPHEHSEGDHHQCDGDHDQEHDHRH